MKILCLLVVLANIFLFFWEYRSGAFGDKTSAHQPLIQGREPIILARELKHPSKPKLSSEPKQPDFPKPANGIIELQQQTEKPNLAPSSKDTGQPEPLPP